VFLESCSTAETIGLTLHQKNKIKEIIHNERPPRMQQAASLIHELNYGKIPEESIE
jgi:hypothetical protein